jgi:histidinol-phosphate aminotransferase
MASEALANGASVVHVPVDGDHVIDLAQIALAITPSTKMISLVNPNNPLGTIIPKSEMATLIGSIPPGIIIVVDEAYHDYVTNSDYESCVRYVGDLSPVIVVRTFSKVYGLAGARVGYSISSPQLTGMIASSQLYGVISRNGQSAAGAALTDDSHISATLALNVQAREMLQTGLTNMGLGYIPSETNFMMFDTGGNAGLIEGQLLSRGYQVRTGWGMPNHIRVSTGLLNEVGGFLAALADILNLNSVGSSEPPRTFGINSVYPNPFNSNCKIEFTTAGPGIAHLSIYNLQGRKVRTIVSDRLSPGVHTISWNGTDVHGKKVSSGVYVFNLLQGELAATSKVTLMN